MGHSLSPSRDTRMVNYIISSIDKLSEYVCTTYTRTADHNSSPLTPTLAKCAYLCVLNIDYIQCLSI